MKTTAFKTMALCALLVTVAACGEKENMENIKPNDGEKAVAVTSVTLSQTTTGLTVGDTLRLTVTVKPDNATNKAVTWTSSKTTVATVANGKVTAVAVGTTNITATTQNGNKTATCVVTVSSTVAATGVKLSDTLAWLAPGSTKTLTATVLPTTATNKTVEWISSNTQVAMVSNGTIVAVANGTTTIAAVTQDGGKTATCLVQVGALADSVTLSLTTATLLVGSTQQLRANVQPSNAINVSGLIWTNSNTAVATVNSNGLVTAVAVGTATITATITTTTEDGSKTATCTVTVNPIPVTSISLDPTSTTLVIGGNARQLCAIVQPANATYKSVTWTSSNPAVATVSMNNNTGGNYNYGSVTPIAVGTATITATTEDGSKTANCAVTVITSTSNPDGSLTIGNTTWAATNVDAPRTFAVRPDMYTPLYSLTANSCPAGWRVPSKIEYEGLLNAGSTWVTANAKGNAVAGRFYGINHATCELPDNINGCIFMPACGTGTPDSQGNTGNYWTSSFYSSQPPFAYAMFFSNFYSGDTNGVTTPSSARSIRCVQ